MPSESTWGILVSKSPSIRSNDGFLLNRVFHVTSKGYKEVVEMMSWIQRVIKNPSRLTSFFGTSVRDAYSRVSVNSCMTMFQLMHHDQESNFWRQRTLVKTKFWCGHLLHQTLFVLKTFGVSSIETFTKVESNIRLIQICECYWSCLQSYPSS